MPPRADRFVDAGALVVASGGTPVFPLTSRRPNRPVKRTLQVLLALFGAIDIAIGLAHVAIGPASIPGAVPMNATMDSEERFYATLFCAFGAAVLWCVKDLERKAAVVYLLMLTFLMGGLARVVSWVVVGPPNAFFQAMLAVELVLPVLLAWMQRRICSSDVPA
jgi:uncharacterized protein DUF4345